MIKGILGTLSSAKAKMPVIYSILLIIAIPTVLIINTWWNVRSFERDMDFAVREKALGMQRSFAAVASTQPTVASNLNNALEKARELEPSLLAASVLVPDNNDGFEIVAGSDAREEEDGDIFLNQLVWSEEKSYFAKVYDEKSGQNVWMVISPIYNTLGNKYGLLNFRVSSLAVDEVVARTTKDALIILATSTVLVILLLINHLRFFEQSLMVDKLKKLDELKDDFISVATHELKNPIVVVRGAASMIRDNYQNQMKEEHRNWLDMIDSGVSDLNNLVQDLLNVTRIEQGRLDFSLTPLNVATIVTDVCKKLEYSAQGKGLTIHNYMYEKEVMVMGQEDRLREVFLNLVGNAIKYTPEGTVTVNFQDDPKGINLIVKDTGVGITPANKEKLFNRFVRIYNEKTDGVPGTGLGLWITKALVERMEGKIFVDSVINEGTVFTVYLKKPDVK